MQKLIVLNGIKEKVGKTGIPPQIFRKLEKIAKDKLFCETLLAQGWDSKDFHDVSVWGIRDALYLAYKLGKEDAEKQSKGESQ